MSKKVLRTTKIGQVTQKGGNGKTTITLNLGYELSLLNKKVLMLDVDPQASLSKNLVGEEKLPAVKGIEELYLNPALDPAEFIRESGMKNVFIIPSHSTLSGIPATLLYEGDGFFTLRKIIENMEKDFDFDYILIDTPGNLEFLTLSAILASDHLIIPVYPALYSLLAINDLINTIEKMKRNYGSEVEILGVLLTMMDRRANLYKEFEEEVREYFGKRAFKTSTSRTVKSEEATLKGTGVSELFPDCLLSSEYKNLIGEIISRMNTDEEQSSTDLKNGAELNGG